MTNKNNQHLNKLIEEEKNHIKVNAITCSCFAIATGGELTLSMFNPDIANFMITGGFAIFTGANAYWMVKHYNKLSEYEEQKTK